MLTRRRTRGSWTKETRPKSHRPKGVKETRPRMTLSRPSMREAYEKVLTAKPDLAPRVVDKGLSGKNPLPWVALGARLLDVPPEKTVNVNTNNSTTIDVSVTAGAVEQLTDSEIHQFMYLLKKIGVELDQLSEKDRALLPALVGETVGQPS